MRMQRRACAAVLLLVAVAALLLSKFELWVLRGSILSSATSPRADLLELKNAIGALAAGNRDLRARVKVLETREAADSVLQRKKIATIPIEAVPPIEKKPIRGATLGDALQSWPKIVAKAETRMAVLEMKYGKAVLRNCTQLLNANFNLLASNLAYGFLNIQVVGGSNTAGGGIMKEGQTWPVVLQENLQRTLTPMVQVEVQSSANGGTTTTFSMDQLVNHVNKTNRLILWEYALNDFRRNMVAEHMRVGEWLQQAKEMFPHSSFGFLLLDDGSDWKHKHPMHCLSADLALAAIKRRNGAERFVASVCDFQRFRGLGGTAAAEEVFWELWGDEAAKREVGHLTPAGLERAAELLEYALYRALRTVTGVSAREDTSGAGAQGAGARALSRLPLPPAPSAFELSPSRSRVLSFFLPNWGEIPEGATFQCAGSAAEPLANIIGGPRGCLRMWRGKPEMKCRQLWPRKVTFFTSACDTQKCPLCVQLMGDVKHARTDTKLQLVFDRKVACSLPEVQHVTFGNLSFGFRWWNGQWAGQNEGNEVRATYISSEGKRQQWTISSKRPLKYDVDKELASLPGGKLQLCLSKSVIMQEENPKDPFVLLRLTFGTNDHFRMYHK